SAEKANTVSFPTPKAGAASHTRRSVSTPARWPAERGRPCVDAQRPLPSMMTARCRLSLQLRELCIVKLLDKKKRALLSALALLERDHFRKPVSAFWDHALGGRRLDGEGRGVLRDFGSVAHHLLEHR